jgi:hypothetical protein
MGSKVSIESILPDRVNRCSRFSQLDRLVDVGLPTRFRDNEYDVSHSEKRHELSKRYGRGIEGWGRIDFLRGTIRGVEVDCVSAVRRVNGEAIDTRRRAAIESIRRMIAEGVAWLTRRCILPRTPVGGRHFALLRSAPLKIPLFQWRNP